MMAQAALQFVALLRPQWPVQRCIRDMRNCMQFIRCIGKPICGSAAHSARALARSQIKATPAQSRLQKTDVL